MVLIPCISSRSSSSCNASSQSTSPVLYESSTCSQPLPLRSPFSSRDAEDSLSSSLESISSIKSNSSSRWSAEREAERNQKRELLNLSLAKMRASNNVPLRKQLHLVTTIKLLQRDLDLLDDEELYCTLIGEDSSMEVDERRWLAPAAQAPPVAEPAPPVVEEREAPVQTSPKHTEPREIENTWSWTSSRKSSTMFDSIQEVLDSSCSSDWSWTNWSSLSPMMDHSALMTNTDPWAPSSLSDFSDPFASSLSRFELQHLFPSQVLLQA